MRGFRWAEWRGGGLRIAVASVLVLTLSGPPLCCGQAREGSAVPRDVYFLALQSFYAGQYRDALKGFQSAARSGIRSSAGAGSTRSATTR